MRSLGCYPVADRLRLRMTCFNRLWWFVESAAAEEFCKHVVCHK
jgi:hypothetical protein